MPVTVDAKVVRSFLQKACASVELRRSRQLVRFLEFLVEHALANDHEPLNERTIAEKVFERSSSWDPTVDTIVRTEIRRLRSKLDQYYERDGAADPVRILLPRGGYFAEIEWVGPTPEPEIAPAPAPVPRWPSPSAVWVFAGVVILAVVVLVLVARQRHQTTERVFVGHPFASAVGKEFSPAISPDGKEIAYVWDGDGSNLDIYIKGLDGSVPRRLTTDPAPDLYPAWSPDGSQIAFLRMGDQKTDVLVEDLHTGKERTITQIRTEFGRWAENLSPTLGDPGPAWTPDGQALIVSDAPLLSSPSNGLYHVAINTGLRQQITRPPGEARDFFPRVSPDGRWLAFIRYYTHGIGELYVMPNGSDAASSQSPKQLTADKRLIRGATWQRNSKAIVFASNRKGSMQLWVIGLQGTPPELIPLTSDSASEPMIGKAGDAIAYVDSSENWNIWEMTIKAHKGYDARRLIASSGINKSPAYSNDGTQIAFLSDRSGSTEVWICNIDGSGLRQLTTFGGPYIGSLNWSPDDRTLAVDARLTFTSQIYTVSVKDGTVTRVEENNFEERSPSWLADGSGILFNSNRGGEVEVWSKSLRDGTLRKIAGAPMFATRMTPNGQTLYISDITGRLFASHPNGSDLTPLADGARSLPVAGWTACSDGVFFPVDQPNDKAATLLSIAAGKTYVLGTTQGHLGVNSPDLSIAPDCTRLLYVQQDHVGSDIKIVTDWQEHSAAALRGSR